VFVAGIYCQQAALVDAFDAISEYFKPFLSPEGLISGDFNLDLLTPASDVLKNICLDFNLTQLISKTTCIHVRNPANSSLIDNTLKNSPYKYLLRVVFANVISDHCPIACIKDTQQKNMNPCIIVCFYYPQEFHDMYCL
jgi:hypothetical protein